MADDPKKFLIDEERFALLTHVEQLLKQIGEQDIRYEQCQVKAKGPDATPRDRFNEDRARGQLELLVHQVIELARGIALRDQGKHNDREDDPSLN